MYAYVCKWTVVILPSRTIFSKTLKRHMFYVDAGRLLGRARNFAVPRHVVSCRELVHLRPVTILPRPADVRHTRPAHRARQRRFRLGVPPGIVNCCEDSGRRVLLRKIWGGDLTSADHAADDFIHDLFDNAIVGVSFADGGCT